KAKQEYEQSKKQEALRQARAAGKMSVGQSADLIKPAQKDSDHKQKTDNTSNNNNNNGKPKAVSALISDDDDEDEAMIITIITIMKMITRIAEDEIEARIFAELEKKEKEKGSQSKKLGVKSESKKEVEANSASKEHYHSATVQFHGDNDGGPSAPPDHSDGDESSAGSDENKFRQLLQDQQ
ncbi:hypothetical protein RFI_33334, partial [Reticulomyxa filosa]